MTFVSLADELAGADHGEESNELRRDDLLDLLDYEAESELGGEAPRMNAFNPQYRQDEQHGSRPGAMETDLVIDNLHATPRRGHVGLSKSTPNHDSPASIALSAASSYRTAPTSPEGNLHDGSAEPHRSSRVGRPPSRSPLYSSPLRRIETMPTGKERLTVVDDLDEVSSTRYPSPSLSISPDALQTPDTFLERSKDPLVELQDCLSASQRLTLALRRLDREHGSRETEAGLERLTRMVHDVEKERDDHIRQVQLLSDGFAQINWGRGLEISPLPPSCLADETLGGDGRTWSEEGGDSPVNDIASPTNSEADDSSWPPSSWSGTRSDFSIPDIDTCDMDEILRNMELSELAADAENLHHQLVQDQEEPLMAGLRALDETLSISLSHSTHAARQLRGIKAAVVSAREADEDERSARDGVEAWERAKMQRGLRGDTAGTEARLRELCQGWERSIDAWGQRMGEIRAAAANARLAPLGDLEKRHSRVVPVL